MQDACNTYISILSIKDMQLGVDCQQQTLLTLQLKAASAFFVYEKAHLCLRVQDFGCCEAGFQQTYHFPHQLIIPTCNVLDYPHSLCVIRTFFRRRPA